ncbi:MAG: hypothetical protein ACK5Y6_00530 [Pseudomonadota bacterium]
MALLSVPAVIALSLSAAAYAQQCSDGIDNDGDGKVDALVLLGNNEESIKFGPFADPGPDFARELGKLITSKKLPYTATGDHNGQATGILRSENNVINLDTAQAVCKVLGFKTYVDSTCTDGEKCNFHSPDNNYLWRFSSGDFRPEGAAPKTSKTWFTSITCKTKLAACSDGIDNDGDGKVDTADTGCASADDNSELVHDPKCITTTSVTEAEQCRDNTDNDKDGLTDRADPGCWAIATDPNSYDPNRDNEAAATSQCKDGVDNDKDGVSDKADPGCWTNPADPNTYDPTRNNEAAATTQCQDGKDNDGDTLIDLKDPGCSAPTDNDEANAATPQCRDGIDNDKDGVSDKDDPGCWKNPSDPASYDANLNNEAAATTQCQDGKDNDSDTLIDLKDPGCSAPTDNDETNAATPQCRDGIDNDKDGVSDKDDPGCWKNPSDPASYDANLNNEAAATTQCQDGQDNDNDTVTDMKDPGCSAPTDNNEGDEPSMLTLGLECVTVNTDNSKTAYLSYNNTTTGALTVSTNATEGTVNEFVTSGQLKVAPPTSFKTGIAKAAVVVNFSGESLTWVVRPKGGALSQASANANSKKCETVTPVAECRGYSGGVMKVRMGYNNPNGFEQEFAIGALNQFTSGKADRGQPTKFFAGLNKSAFEIALEKETENVTWALNGARITTSTTLPTCVGMSIDVPTGTIGGNLNSVALQLSQVMNRAAAALASAKATKTAREQARDDRDKRRVQAKASGYESLANSLTIQIPAVTKTCPEAPQFCVTVDRQSTIDALRGLYANQRNSIMRTMARLSFRNSGVTTRDDGLVKQGKALEAQGVAELAKLPRFETVCK